MNPKILLATITSDLPRYYEYYDSLDRLILPPGTDKCQIHSSSPAKNRNVVIKKALERDYTHIFFTDDDNVFLPDTLMKLLKRNVDIVSGIYTIKYPPFSIIALNDTEFINMNQYEPGELVEVPRAPAGCLLVRISALIKMQAYIDEKWFTIGQIHSDLWGDDLWFCDYARKAGLRIYLDTDVPVGHMTKCVLWPKYNKEEKRWEVDFSINGSKDAV